VTTASAIRPAGTAAVFLDRDGVLNEVVERAGEPGSPRSLNELKLVADLHAVQRLQQAGLRVFIITNQPDVARGHTTPAELDRMMAAITSQIPVDDYRVCRHRDGDGCDCRKPLPGMIFDLAAQWDIDVARSFVIGDMWRDVEAARAAGARSILIRAPYNGDARPDHSAASLSEAVHLVLQFTATRA
jgi:D-glycero-D-manno-heptose 1,7-bisphosphate phosphatase